MFPTSGLAKSKYRALFATTSYPYPISTGIAGVIHVGCSSVRERPACRYSLCDAVDRLHVPQRVTLAFGKRHLKAPSTWKVTWKARLSTRQAAHMWRHSQHGTLAAPLSLRTASFANMAALPFALRWEHATTLITTTSTTKRLRGCLMRYGSHELETC